MSEIKKNSNERSYNTKKVLKEAFCILYQKESISKISVSDITKLAGYNRSTFYQYYENIDSLMLEIEDDIMDKIISKRLSMNVQDEEFIKNLAELYDDNKIYLDAMLGVNRNFHFEKRIKEYAKFMLTETNLKVNDVYFSYIWEYRFNGMFSLFRLWIQKNKEISIEEFLKLIKKLYY